VYCAGKTPEQALGIITAMRERGIPVLATRAGKETAALVCADFPEAAYDALSGVLTISSARTDAAGSAKVDTFGNVAVVCAGTSDLPVAREALLTARFYGSDASLITDVGVAGIHRLFARLDDIRVARVIVAVAGMEGALPGVIAGLVRAPVIAVPTSVGYGASFGGLASLLGMLNSCSPGVAVVNIDNGFGAGYLANTINRGYP
jgi:NCAIR mutase (PurE)-related protein